MTTTLGAVEVLGGGRASRCRRRRRLRRAARSRRRPAIRAHRRGLPRHPRVLPGAGSYHPATDRRARVHGRRGRGRLARRVPCEPIRDGAVTRPRCQHRALRLSSLPGVDVAQPGRAPVRRMAASAQRRAQSPGDQGRLLRPRPVQPASLDRSGDRVSRSRRPGRGSAGRATATAASITSGAKARPMATRSRTDARFPCENEVVAQLVSLRSSSRRLPAPRRLGRRGRVVLRGAERARRARRRGVLPADVPGRSVVVEPPRPAHGRHARRAGRAPRLASSAGRRSSCGSTTRTSATHARPPWALAAS